MSRRMTSIISTVDEDISQSRLFIESEHIHNVDSA